MRRSIPAISAILLLLGALTGCNEDPKPIEPSGSATAIPVPTMPAQASEDTVEGRAAFAFHFVNLVNHTAMTGDTKPILAIASDCRECAELAENMRNVRIDGQRPNMPIWTVEKIEPLVEPSRIVVTIASQPEIDVEGFELALITTTEPPYSVQEMGQLQ